MNAPLKRSFTHVALVILLNPCFSSITKFLYRSAGIDRRVLASVAKAMKPIVCRISPAPAPPPTPGTCFAASQKILRSVQSGAVLTLKPSERRMGRETSVRRTAVSTRLMAETTEPNVSLWRAYAWLLLCVS